MAVEFKLPDLGENVPSGEVINVLVSVGDQVARDQPVIELETDKAVIEVPCAVSGRVREIHVSQGDTAAVDQIVLTIDEDAPPASVAETSTAAPATPEPAPDPNTPAPNAPAPEEPVAAPTEPSPVTPSRGANAPAPVGGAPTGDPVPAAPSVRRLAREIGLDVSQVKGSGPGGRISEEDVKAHSRGLNQTRAVRPSGTAHDPSPLPDLSKWGEVERQPMSSVRRATAEHMTRAWATIPHATQYDHADVTELESWRRQYGPRALEAGGKLTPTVIILKVVAAALKRFPNFNASLDAASQEIVYKRYCHIGVAVDTDRGLLVPVVRHVDEKNLIELAAELTQIAERARRGKLDIEEMRGGCFTISNLGGIGGDGMAPIINAPEVAILGVARSRREPVWSDDGFSPGLVMPLALSYDHRLIDGADGARFLRWIAEALEDPFLLALEG